MAAERRGIYQKRRGNYGQFSNFDFCVLFNFEIVGITKCVIVTSRFGGQIGGQFAAWRLIWRSIRCLEVNLEVNSLFGGQFGCPFAVWRSSWRSIRCLGDQFGGQFATPRARLGRRPGFTRGCRNSGKRKLCGPVPGQRKLCGPVPGPGQWFHRGSSSTLGQFRGQFTV